MTAKKSTGNILVLIAILLLTYVVFGIFIVGGGGSPGKHVEGYRAGYSEKDSSQLKGIDLIKDNWRRVREDKKLMQLQVDTKRY